MLNNVIKFFLENKLVTALLAVLIIGWGIMTAPFDWELTGLPRDPVPVDAIPDLGENQQIVFTNWPGRSPQDIEDQITYPLTTSLLGIPGVKSIRSSSMFGFSSIYIIFDEGIEFYWSRSRILEKLNSLPSGLLPDDARPALGPDATALGQVFWYTLEGRDTAGNPTGGWGLDELRTIQDFYVKYGLSSASGVSEVASIGGYVKEYQVDVRPDAMRAYNVGLQDVMLAVKNSNRDVGAKTIEINKAEYLVRGLGYIKTVKDLEDAVIRSVDNTPIRIKDVAVVTLGPATRRGALDKGGAEVAGGVVVARYGANPLQVIKNVKGQIAEMQAGLPSKVLEDGTVSKVTIVPFYDRTQLIYETLGTLEEALTLEILITIIVIIVMVINLRASIAIASLTPLAILMVFIAMRYTGVDANIVALSGIAIAIGTMVDLGIILTENVIKYIDEEIGDTLLERVYRASAEVSGAIVTAVSTTIVSFIPVFTLQAAEGRLFHPLAFTKSYALVGAVIVALFIMPALLHWLFGLGIKRKSARQWLSYLLIPLGIIILFWSVLGGVVTLLLALAGILQEHKPSERWYIKHSTAIVVLIAIVWVLAEYWMPLGVGAGLVVNIIFVAILSGLVLGFFSIIIYYYKSILSWCLYHKKTFLSIPLVIVVLGVMTWLGFNKVFGFIANGAESIGWNLRETRPWVAMNETFPGAGKEFMPALNEGSFLLMPTSMPHSGMEENLKTLREIDMRVNTIPEVEMVVGKMGRAESALDPAPISMYENIINYKPEYAVGKDGQRLRFAVDEDGKYLLRSGESISREEIMAMDLDFEKLQQDKDGEYFRNWREHIQSPDDIWNEIVNVTNLPGVTSAPKLQPIETRLVMLQTGMRAPMGIKIKGPDLKTLEDFGFQLESILKTVPSVKKEAVFADRVVGKPYLEIDIDRNAISRYGLSVEDVQKSIETGIGGMQIGVTVEGRERFPIRVRYPRELRDDPEKIKEILVTNKQGVQIPLGQLASMEFVKGPQVIKSEETFLTSYVLFDKTGDYSEVTVVNDAQDAIQMAIDNGELEVPSGVSYRFSGNYENQIRAEKRLSIVVPVVLLIIFLILYFQFRSVTTSMMVFSGIAVAFAGGFIMLWLYGQDWFMNFQLFGTDLRNLFQVKTINLSVAVWVGFIALFGIATDDGVLMATYLDQRFAKEVDKTREGIRAAVIEAGQRRVRPALMTTATTLIALVPILTSSGKGSDIMIPMAIPAFGGMTIATITIFVVPVIYSMWVERKLLNKQSEESSAL
ncbi:putative silver efflux pump [Owenweeksia hongkongensis DSM 17368]|uniref:Putative silver efflux pump n=1 Tax=Owenweeksia hongkongensis (strain DSM 17368 / CIP 108786 / JCM 12287 / NRRL B-23963 / UST20020801) TaxID=926562 RepID=G8QZR0_OWEHD|nr:efflux RND transporter permease subunit [Owenweeksia hongkongensis]AEV31504.1 putative silver efflux pump [Owenweeksia hongkongensis DSM 17368]